MRDVLSNSNLTLELLRRSSGISRVSLDISTIFPVTQARLTPVFASFT